MAKSPALNKDQIELTSRTALAEWLGHHHARNDGVWLIRPKKHAVVDYLDYDDLVTELIRFGWVDSLPRHLDDERSMLYISPRKAGSAWSEANKSRAESLIASGLMTNAGLAKVTAAQADGSWTFLDDVQNLTIPEDLSQALSANPQAEVHFLAFPPSSKRNILEWIKQAKQPETRAKRIAETVEKAAVNIRANHYRQKGESA